MDYEFLVIGGGVVGLAVAEHLSGCKHSVLLIEKENRTGSGVSSRNSEVIHAGIYYPKNSLKSILCIRGNKLLYEWCEKHNVSFRRTGKFIIATNEDELRLLETIKENASEAGMTELFFRTGKEIMDQEKDIHCTGGLYSPSTGIISAHDLMNSLKACAEQQNTDFVFCSQLHSVSKNLNSYKVSIINDSGERSDVEVGSIINCAGLYCDKVAEKIGIYNDRYRIKFSKGNYFRLTGMNHSIQHLIYPVPVRKLKGLGIHITLDLNNQVKFGPDIEEMEDNIEDYGVNESRSSEFYKAVKTYFPAICEKNLVPEMAGIRPRLAAEDVFPDFIIKEESSAGFPGVINCIGIESPGLTASLAIAEYIKRMIS